MRRSKKVYENYVCPYCFNALNRCICELYPPYHLVLIDKNIQEHIRVLNEKGYRTTGCCEGHGSTYIAFAREYFENIKIPQDFKYDKKRRIISYVYSSKLSKKEMENLKNEKLEILLEWCNNLPSIDVGN